MAPLDDKINWPLLFIGIVAFGFLVFDGVSSGFVTIGTIALNAAGDFEFSELITVLAFYFLVECLLRDKPALNAKEIKPVESNIRDSLAVAIVFGLVMGIELRSAVTACGLAVVIGALLNGIRITLTTKGGRKSFVSKTEIFRFGIALSAASCALILTLRGSAHIGEAAALGFLGLVVVGGQRRWINLAGIRALLEYTSRATLILGGAFLAAALWNLLANWHLNLKGAMAGLGIPDAAVFPIGLLVMLALSLRIRPLSSLIVAAPVLYLGLESFAWPPAWSVPLVAAAIFMTLCVSGRLSSFRVAGFAGATVLVGLVVSAFGFIHPEISVSSPSAASLHPAKAHTTEVAMADGRTLPAAELAADTWVPVRTSGRAPPRPDHGGSAFDERRRQIVLFGADTHHRDWRNTVTAFDLRSQTWIAHYRSSPRYAMRADAAGNRISGIIQELPWPMHTYDGVVYHPKIDSIVVAASPLHALKAVPNGRFDPTWIYDLKSRRWRKGPVTGETTPRFFGGSAMYDAQRNAIFYFNSVAAEHGHLPIGKESRYFNFDLFQLSEDLSGWARVSDPPPRWQGEAMHRMLVESGKPGFNAEFERRTGDLILFMGNALGTRILRYTHDDTHRSSGRWRSLRAGNETCDTGVPYSVAHSRDGQYLLRPSRTRPTRHLTCNFNVDRNAMVSINAAGSIPARMNFNLHYDTVSGLFVLIHGISLHGGHASVRYLRLGS